MKKNNEKRYREMLERKRREREKRRRKEEESSSTVSTNRESTAPPRRHNVSNYFICAVLLSMISLLTGASRKTELVKQMEVMVLQTMKWFNIEDVGAEIADFLRLVGAQNPQICQRE